MKKTSEENPILSPAAIARKAASMPWQENARIDVFPYEKAIVALRERGYSYGEVATWLSNELKAPVKRGQVYYVCQAREEETREAFEAAEARGEVRTLPNISSEEAERVAAEQDQQRAHSTRKKGAKS